MRQLLSYYDFFTKGNGLMKIKNLILALIIVTVLGTTNIIPTYADPGKETAFEDIFKEFSMMTSNFIYNESESDKIREASQKNRQSNNDVYSAYLELFRSGKGDCMVVASALSKLFTDKGISNRVLYLSYNNINMKSHAVVCYKIDGCKGEKTGFRIADFFAAKNYEEFMLKKGIPKDQIEKWKRNWFSMPLKKYFSVAKNVADVASYEPLDSNRQKFYYPKPHSIELSDSQGGWTELAKACINEEIEFKTDEKWRKRILFEKIRADLLEKYNKSEYSYNEAIEEVSKKLTEGGIQNSVFDVSPSRYYTQKVIFYKDNFLNRSSDKEYCRIFDCKMAFYMMKTGKRDNIIIAHNLLGIYTEESYYKIFGENTN